MKPKLISTNLVLPKLTLILLGLIILNPAFIGIWSDEYYGNIVSNMTLGLAIVGLGVYLLRNNRSVTFDDTYMYITTRKQVRQIPLESTNKIKLTLTSFVSTRFIWKLGYIEDLENKEIRILPNAWNNHFKEFKKKVKEKNPTAVIKTWSHSFDFDQ